MAARRIRKLTLPCREFNEMVAQAGNASNEAIAAFYAGGTHVSDLRCVEVSRDGDSVVVYFESATFPELGCCYKKSAPEWLVVQSGEQRG